MPPRVAPEQTGRRGLPSHPRESHLPDETGPSPSGREGEETQAHVLSLWGGLERLELIGSGGFGRVYRAFDPTLAREVALKIIRLSEPGTAAAILREGQLLARVRHRNIVAVYWAQLIGDEVGLCMELVRGRPLADIVHRDGPLSPEEATIVGASLCHALAAVHGAGLVHRDLKARNVMREAGGRIVLMDFGAGLERREVCERPHRHSLTGTPLYMAPEAMLGHPVTPVSDIYSLGVLLYFLVTGRFPVEGQTVADLVIAHGTGMRQLLVDVRPDLPDGFVRVVERALASDPSHRYPSAGAMMRDLLELLPGVAAWAPSALDLPERPTLSREAGAAPDTAGPPRAAAPARRSALHHVGPAAAALVAALLVLGALGFVTSTAFNLTLGRAGGFADESAWSWPIWGARSVVAPVVYMALAIGPVLLTISVWRLMSAISPSFRSWSASLGAQVKAGIARLRLDEPGVAAQVLVAMQLGLLGVVWWRFGYLIQAFSTFLADADRATLAALSPANIDEHILYGRVLDGIILVTAIAWVRVLRLRRHQPSTDRPAAVVAGVSLLAIFVFLLVAPYRILWQNEFERVAFDGERCYIIGRRAEQALLYCPQAPAARHRVVSLTDARIESLHVLENIFAPF